LDREGVLLSSPPSKFEEQILEEGWIVGLSFDNLKI